MTIPIITPTRTLHRPAHTTLRPNRQLSLRIPLILDIIRRPLEAPIAHLPTPINLLLQTLPIGPQLRIREILPPDLKLVEEELVRDVAAVFCRFGGCGG